MTPPVTLRLPQDPSLVVDANRAEVLRNKIGKRSVAEYTVDGEVYRVYLPPKGTAALDYLVEAQGALPVMIGTVERDSGVGWRTDPLIVGAVPVTSLPSIPAAIRALFPLAQEQAA